MDKVKLPIRQEGIAGSRLMSSSDSGPTPAIPSFSQRYVMSSRRLGFELTGRSLKWIRQESKVTLSDLIICKSKSSKVSLSSNVDDFIEKQLYQDRLTGAVHKYHI